MAGACRRQGRWTRAVVLAVVAGWSLSASAAPADDGALSDINYRLGDGLHLPGLGLNLGGYATTTYRRLDERTGRVSLGDMSLSVWWEGTGRWKAFAEFDYENAVSSGSARRGDEDRYLALERIYVDYAVSDTATVRVGKFLTPIGRWNLIHATPLVWTTSRPLVTTLAFPTNVTGLMFSSNATVAGKAIEYMVYGSSGDEVRPNPALDTFHEALGLRVVAPLPSAGQLGLSYVNFEQGRTLPQRKELFGFDLLWSREGWELSAESVYRRLREEGVHNEVGGYLQLVAPLGERLRVVARAESYRMTQQNRSVLLWITGISYRIHPAIVLKAEWVGARRNTLRAAEGFLSSISVLF
jgi:hypothetical protein